MKHISERTLQFLSALKENNNRDWFNDHKSAYQEAHEDFIAFVNQFIKGLVAFDPSVAHHEAKDCVFRIYRDVRFSKDKSPYKAHFGAHVSPAFKRSDIHSRAGYYLHIEPGNRSMIGGGAYMPNSKWLDAIRKEIDYNPEGLLSILEKKDFKTYFKGIEGDRLVRPPKGYQPDHPQIEWLKYKSMYVMHSIGDDALTKPGFLPHALDVSRALYPLNNYLNKAAEA